jgi:peptidoglycan/LPS O-acetylase OafA/YrhL
LKFQRDRIPSLDGLRAVALLLVLIGHAFGTIPQDAWLRKLWYPFSEDAHRGVFIFFVISGYLITYLLKSEWDRHGKIDLLDFYRRRILRIFPAFYFYLVVIASLTAIGIIHVSNALFVAASLFLWNYCHLWIPSSNAYGTWYLGHFWSLSLEEQFYLIWPFLLSLAKPVRASRIAATLIIAIIPLRIITYFVFPGDREYVSIMLHTTADPVMFGCLAALLQGTSRYEDFMDRYCRIPLVACATMFLLIISPQLELRFHGVYACTVGWPLESMCIVLLMTWLIRWPDSPVGRVLNSRLLVHIGALSYSLYIWQQLFLTRLNTTWTGIFPINILICFLVAEMSYHWIEQPFLRLRKRPPVAPESTH